MTHSLKSLPDYAVNGDSSKFPARIVATVPPFNEMLQPASPLKIPLDPKVKHLNGTLLKPNKIVSTLAANFCLRCTEELCTQGTQTESNNNLNNNNNNSVPSHGDLRAEIQKLNQFRERVEERGGDLAFCRERLSALEDKIRLYERNGNSQECLLNEKLEKEAQLTAQVQQLTAKIAQLQEEKTRLDEQRCELEEAENDTRLRCQKLEMKLQIISEENRDFQSKLLQERRASANLKSSLLDGEKLHREVSYLQSMLSTYEERNYELEERETDLKHQLELLVQWWPLVVAWNIYETASAFQRKAALPIDSKPHSPRRPLVARRDPPRACNGLCRNAQERLVQRMKELERELRERLDKEELLQKTDRETMTEVCPEPVQSAQAHHEECAQKLRSAAQLEAQLKSKVRDLEQKEKAYMETLQEADELWSELEGGYQRQVQELQATEAELRARLDAAEQLQRQQRSNDHEVTELEQSVHEAGAALRRAEEEKAALATRAAQLGDALAAADAGVERLTHEADHVLRPRIAHERRLNADLQRELRLKADAMDALQDAFDKDIEKLKCQIFRLEKENLQLNKESDELKLGMDRLQTILKEQQEHLMKEREQSEKALANISNTLAEKERELQSVLALTRDEDVRSAQEELEEAEASFSPSQMHKSTDIESEDETNVPQYSTFPRTSREKTLLPPIKPPRRVKKGDIRRAKEAMSSKSCSLESITNTQVTAEVGFKGRNRSLQDITAEGLTGSFLMISPDRNERAPTPIPNTKREANSTKKPYMSYLSTAEVNKCQTSSENVGKPAVRGWRSQPESLRKPRNLPGIDLCLSPSSAVYYIGTI